jgi:hypothetical protein
MTRKIAQGLIAGMRQSVRPEVLKLRDFVHGRPQADGRGQEHREPRRRREPAVAPVRILFLCPFKRMLQRSPYLRGTRRQGE